MFSSTRRLESEIKQFDHPVVEKCHETKEHKREILKRTPPSDTVKTHSTHVDSPCIHRTVSKNTLPNRTKSPLQKLLPPLRENSFKAIDHHTPYNLEKLTEDQIIDLLLKIASEESETTSIRYYAVKNLAYFNRPELSRETAPLLGANEPAIRFAAADTIARIGGADAASELIKALHDENPYVRSSAASGLAVLGDDRSLAPLIKLCKDSDEIVRFSAERSLHSLSKNKEITNLINKMIKDGSPAESHL